jgi:hypothetical protein
VDLLTAAAAGAAVAPELERLRGSIARSAPALLRDLAEATGVGPLLPPFSMLRNLPGRSASQRAIREVFLYQPVDVDGALTGLAEAGLVVLEGGEVRLSEAGTGLDAEMHRRLGRFVDDLWADHAAAVDEAGPLVQRVVESATETGGLAFSVMAPVWEPPGTSPATLLAERLTPLRFHRFDAHIAAWRAAGLSVAEVQALEPGPARDELEAETDRLAAPPYEALNGPERAALLAALERLPGATTPP